ncbi:MAG: hypothetical protein M5R36_23800 [Deltaproteobacteria bacterium]|nr:hypothetical protein [Deltaproteobacteria bacterium]
MAIDLYVNALEGDDCADGATPETARKTITGILELLPDPLRETVVIHVTGTNDQPAQAGKGGDYGERLLR